MLEAVHRRGHGGLYAGVAHGRVDTNRLRLALASGPLPRAADCRLVLAVDITCRLRPDAHTSPELILCHTYGRGKDQDIPFPAGRSRSSARWSPVAARGPHPWTRSAWHPGTAPPPSLPGSCAKCSGGSSRRGRSFTPTYASWANPIDVHFGPLRQFAIANSNHPNHPVQTRALPAYLRWRSANARHPDILAAQRRERARFRGEKRIPLGRTPHPRDRGLSRPTHAAHRTRFPTHRLELRPSLSRSSASSTRSWLRVRTRIRPSMFLPVPVLPRPQ